MFELFENFEHWELLYTFFRSLCSEKLLYIVVTGQTLARQNYSIKERKFTVKENLRK